MCKSTDNSLVGNNEDLFDRLDSRLCKVRFHWDSDGRKIKHTLPCHPLLDISDASRAGGLNAYWVE